jgi:hypothetical protein
MVWLWRIASTKDGTDLQMGAAEQEPLFRVVIVNRDAE